LEEVALNTELLSGADLKNVIREASLYALEDGGMSDDRVEYKHFMIAQSTIKPSLTKAKLEQFKLI